MCVALYLRASVILQIFHVSQPQVLPPVPFPGPSTHFSIHLSLQKKYSKVLLYTNNAELLFSLRWPLTQYLVQLVLPVAYSAITTSIPHAWDTSSPPSSQNSPSHLYPQCHRSSTNFTRNCRLRSLLETVSLNPVNFQNTSCLNYSPHPLQSPWSRSIFHTWYYRSP